jgi:hypothetical protein
MGKETSKYPFPGIIEVVCTVLLEKKIFFLTGILKIKF